MKKFKKISIVTVLAIALVLGFAGPNVVYAATSPTLVGSINYSVLGATTVTNTGATTTTGEVGVSVGSSITGFAVPGGPGFAGGDNAVHVHLNDASAIAAKADTLTAFGALDAGANADVNCLDGLGGSNVILTSGTDLATLGSTPGTLPSGLYCSAGSFSLTNARTGSDLILTGAGPWVFKTVSALNISSGATMSVATGSACDVWWRVGSSATLGTGSSFIGSILALTDIDLLTGATLEGRAMVQTAAVDLDANTISGPICAAPVTTVRRSSSGSMPLVVVPVFQPTIDIISTPVVYVAPVIPTLPKTGFPPQESGTWYESLLNNILNLFR